MFSGFDLKISKQFFGDKFEEYRKKGQLHLDSQKANYENELKSYIVNGTIDGSQILNEWFPMVKADIFFSHSHDDKDLTCALAGWMNEKFNLNCFIDSNVWGWSENLLEMLNEKFSDKRKNPQGGWLYDHESCNRVSQHVNVMLSVALQKMIDKVESVILLNTNQSIRVFDAEQISSTYSPWIYTEIINTKYIQKKPLIVYRDYSSLEHGCGKRIFEENSQIENKMKISYMVPIDHLNKLDEHLLKAWQQEYESNSERGYAFDIVYKYFYPEELNMAYFITNNFTNQELKTIKNYYSGYSQNEVERLEMIRNRMMDNY